MNKLLFSALLIAVIAILYQTTWNLYRFLRCKKLLILYQQWLLDNCDSFPQYRHEVLELFSKAGVQDEWFPISQKIRYNTVATAPSSAFGNFPSKHVAFITSILNDFDEAIGTYRRKLFQCFSPLYWIDQIIFLPKILIKYVGADMEKASSKLIFVLLTAIWWIFNFLLWFFGDSLYAKISEFVHALK